MRRQRMSDTYPNTNPAPRMKMTPGRNKATLTVYTGRNSAQPFQLFCFSNQASIVPKMLKPCTFKQALKHLCLCVRLITAGMYKDTKQQRAILYHAVAVEYVHVPSGDVPIRDPNTRTKYKSTKSTCQCSMWSRVQKHQILVCSVMQQGL